MPSKQQFFNLISRSISRAAAAALAMATVVALTVVLTQSAHAQTYKVLYSFTGANDGGNPYAGLTMDKARNLYGTALNYGAAGLGTVYQLKPMGSNWAVNPLYSFAGGTDAANPWATVIISPDGILYGTTFLGGGDNNNCPSGGCGTVFKLRPSPSACKSVLCDWTETLLHRFAGFAGGNARGDGANPPFGDLIFDRAGDIYGTTNEGGSDNAGTVYKLTPSGSGWTESVLYNFSKNDGIYPSSGVILDNAGNLYGTTLYGGVSNAGTVFQLTPSGSGWTENLLYSFQGGSDGSEPIAGVISDQSGNLYGATRSSGNGGGGTVFELTPSVNGNWTYALIYSFTGTEYCGPWGTLVMDGAGNLYGTTVCDGANSAGSVFKLTPSGGSWTYTSLYDFTGSSDGKNPYCNLLFDAEGNLYGTTFRGGSGPCPYGCGVVWEITP